MLFSCCTYVFLPLALLLPSSPTPFKIFSCLPTPPHPTPFGIFSSPSTHSTPLKLLTAFHLKQDSLLNLGKQGDMPETEFPLSSHAFLKSIHCCYWKTSNNNFLSTCIDVYIILWSPQNLRHDIGNKKCQVWALRT